KINKNDNKYKYTDEEKEKKILKEITQYVKSNKNIDNIKFNKFKVETARKYSYSHIPSNIEILMKSSQKNFYEMRKKISIKPVRNLSGVSVVAIMCKPHKCPHGKCITCPGGVDSYFGDVPQSYTGHEPATLRAIRNDYDPYLQTFNRLEQYIASGKEVDKIELIIMGGTFPSLIKDYRDEFVAYSLKAMNDFSKFFIQRNNEINMKKYKKFFEMPSPLKDDNRAIRIKERVLKLKNSDLFENYKFNEKFKNIENKNYRNLKKQQYINDYISKVKCVAMCMESRPDYALKEHGLEMLDQGVTRIEIGLQSTDDEILEKMNRGHDTKLSIQSIKELKDLAFKINVHYMLGLYGSTKEKDISGLKELFTNENYMPDMLKIYPTMVMQGTILYDLYLKEKQENKKDKYEPITTNQAIEIITEFKKDVPKWVRIMRVQRDIPTNQTFLGVDRTNLRQMIQSNLEKNKIKCNCIRCRQPKSDYKFIEENIEKKIIKYNASQGKEYFICYEDKKEDTILGYIRLRFPSNSTKEALIRELHVYGFQNSIGEINDEDGSVQHKGLGKKLLKEAEEIAKSNNYKEIKIISGIGVRNYYRKQKYKLIGPYMVKKI
ncbi:MAG: tRNA uridine(34) 5-carboxymethylaminomethyl modification radical SAM/GNAT enzyme Elp3, partial [Candidatus Nanoarchaeia archaeon]|nr:tRNA uridine(34) 5-carboxymethylaminomethyl modification radical SAM/GNAT enzyme Elp3 [Candidatus Nanoarchaeia archaeon]